MKTPLVTLLAVALLSALFAATAFAGSTALDVSSAVAAAVPVGGPGISLQEPGTVGVGGVPQLPSTSTDPTFAIFAIGAILMTFGIAMLALRGAAAKR